MFASKDSVVWTCVSPKNGRLVGVKSAQAARGSVRAKRGASRVAPAPAPST
jgi:hypothetical protein